MIQETKGGSAWLFPFVLSDGFAVNQFTLIAICLGLASSRLLKLKWCTNSFLSELRKRSDGVIVTVPPPVHALYDAGLL
jgi:hypothetical protein